MFLLIAHTILVLEKNLFLVLSQYIVSEWSGLATYWTVISVGLLNNPALISKINTCKTMFWCWQILRLVTKNILWRNVVSLKIALCQVSCLVHCITNFSSLYHGLWEYIFCMCRVIYGAGHRGGEWCCSIKGVSSHSVQDMTIHGQLKNLAIWFMYINI